MYLKTAVLTFYYGPNIISITVTKGGHPKGNKLYGTSGTIKQGVAELHS